MVAAYPLAWPQGWPRTARPDDGSRFKERKTVTPSGGGSPYQAMAPVSFPTARDSLYLELQRLGADGVVVSTNHPTDRYGRPVEGKRGVDPGVAVYFNLNGKQMVMASDRFTSTAANMRSLALAIDALRTLERHGGGVMVEKAFAGFAALPPPQRSWREVLGIVTAKPTVTDIVDTYRFLAKRAHPDAGGSTAAMAELTRAKDEAVAEIERRS